jgi:hypothetical protein
LDQAFAHGLSARLRQLREIRVVDRSLLRELLQQFGMKGGDRASVAGLNY